MEQHENLIEVRAGSDTEDLIGFIMGELDDETLDSIDVNRELDRRDDLASEPITIAVVIGLSTSVVVTVGRIIERWLESRRQHENLAVVLDGFRLSEEAGLALAGVASRHAEVSISYPLPETPSPSRVL